MNYFLLTRRKLTGAVICSPLLFPEQEAKRRLLSHTRSVKQKKTHEFRLVPWKRDHLLWNPGLDNITGIALNEFLEYISIAQEKLNLMRDKPRWEDGLTYAEVSSRTKNMGKGRVQ